MRRTLTENIPGIVSMRLLRFFERESYGRNYSVFPDNHHFFVKLFGGLRVVLFQDVLAIAQRYGSRERF